MRCIANPGRQTSKYNGRPRTFARPRLEELFADVTDRATRNEQIYQAVRMHRYTLNEVGGLAGLRYSTISVIGKQISERKKPYK